MYNEDGYDGITFFAYLNNPLAIATKKYLPFTTCTADIHIKEGHF
jgi:hypothetical protein